MTSRLLLACAAAILIAAGVLMFNRLGAADVCSGNEAVEGVFVQQMVEHGEVLFPLENGRAPMYKPPLFHWTALMMHRLAGIHHVSALSLRAPSALYGLAGVALAMALAYSLLGIEGAIFAGLALAGSYQYVSEARIGRVDMTLAFYETLALAAFVWWLPAERDGTARTPDGGPRNRALLYLFAIALGLGVLAKGPVGALLPGGAIVALLVLERRLRQLLAMVEPGPILVGALIASSWYVACYVEGRTGFLNRQLASENVGRFFGSLGSMTPWYYAKPLLFNSTPLSLLVPFAVALVLWRWRSNMGEPGGGAMQLDSKARVAARLFAIFWLITVAFFSIAAYKRRSYLLPLWPVSSILIACLVVTVARARLGAAIKWSYAAVCVALIAFNFIYVPSKEFRDCAASSFRPAAEEINRAVGQSLPLYSYGFDEELAPLLFYLDRNAPVITGKLGDAPPGYVIVPERVWRDHQHEALDLEPVLTSEHGSRRLVLLRRGAAVARN